MNCADCQNQFSDLVDDEISLKMARSVKAHLASCPTCSEQWQHFEKTVTILHKFPIAKVPADFIVGINDKLAPQPFAKLRGWFSFMDQHRMTATTALATLVVGVISAAVLQLGPLDGEQLQAQHEQGTATIQTASVDRNQNNYYPGTPYLSQNSQPTTMAKNRARVQFTPVKEGVASSGHNSIFEYRGPPTVAHSGLSHSPLPRLGKRSPDLVVTVHASSSAYQHALIRQLTTNHTWQTQISGSNLLVTLPASQLASFQHLFGPVDTHINPHELTRLSKASPSGLLTVAVAFH